MTKYVTLLTIFFLTFITKNFFSFLMFYFILFILLNFFNYSNFCFMDNWSNLLMILTFWIFYMTMIYTIFKKEKKLTVLTMNFLFIMLMLCFYSNTVSAFFFFFESSLIPMFMMINVSGSNFKRWESSMYMFAFMVISSMPFLIIISLFLNNNMNYFQNIYIFFGEDMIYMWFFFSSLILCFLIKVPVFFFHIWLPRAHVEAPVFGSMILASILLKLGILGMYRVSMFFYFNKMFMFIILFSIWGSIIISMICLRQTDLKSLIAYSSVVHMCLCIVGIFFLSDLSMMSVLMMLIGHGIGSSFLFFLSNINYERISSRSLILNTSYKNIFLILPIMWFLAIMMNMGFPLTINFMSEMLMINIIFNVSFLLGILFVVIVFFSGIYNMFLLQTVLFSKKSKKYMIPLKSFLFMEYFICFNHLFLIICFSFYLNIYL